MAWSGRSVDRAASRLLYVGLCIVVLWSGSALINYSLVVKLYKDYLLKWEVAAERYRDSGLQWPVFNGANHTDYMGALVGQMRKAGIQVPRSNTTAPYTYVLDHLWGKDERIFVLVLPEKIIIYGLSIRTFEKVDSYVDGVVDMKRGKLVGRIGRDGQTVVAIWGR
ncbi:MAG: hypothetical protein DRH12_16855 [Deltaproteobacteria bacterium]|nr:MAG: hypothetical protein DRH12_16855 [Deltaproteobacteria bacterium]